MHGNMNVKFTKKYIPKFESSSILQWRKSHSIQPEKSTKNIQKAKKPESKFYDAQRHKLARPVKTRTVPTLRISKYKTIIVIDKLPHAVTSAAYCRWFARYLNSKTTAREITGLNYMQCNRTLSIRDLLKEH